MSTSATKTVEIRLRDNDHCKRLTDPLTPGLFHLETWLPFSEAVKLQPGNANVRPPAENRPFREMIRTVENDPASFHLKNRGIIYKCDRFAYENGKRLLTITIPEVEADDDDREPGDHETRFGIADGGHTHKVIGHTMARIDELRMMEDWSEPFVRVHFLSGHDVAVEEVVEALNTSIQVKQHTLDEYNSRFDDLKAALQDKDFDIGLVAFRENEDDKEWDVQEIIQRMACFLKDRWKTVQPTGMYRSRARALSLYTDENTRPEFEKLYSVIADVITLPEFIQSEFGRGQAIKGKRFGGLRAVKAVKNPPYVRPGTSYPTDHTMDVSASLPLAAAFRELLELRGDRYRWRMDPKVVFRHCAEELYRILVAKSRTARNVMSLAQDNEYWMQAVNVVLRAKDELQGQRRGSKN